MEISFRNQLQGKVAEILRGDVVSEVDVDTPAGRISAIVKATEVGIEKP
jgi:molybdopterin-binding protein